MSLDKAIKHDKEKRKPYRRSKRFDCRCRNHGSCDWCRDNRLRPRTKAEKEAEARMEEHERRVV